MASQLQSWPVVANIGGYRMPLCLQRKKGSMCLGFVAAKLLADCLEAAICTFKFPISFTLPTNCWWAECQLQCQFGDWTIDEIVNSKCNSLLAWPYESKGRWTLSSAHAPVMQHQQHGFLHLRQLLRLLCQVLATRRWNNNGEQLDYRSPHLRCSEIFAKRHVWLSNAKQPP